MTAIRILVVDDHGLFRQGLVSILNDMQGVSVVGDVANGLEALPAVQATNPDIVLLDVNMPAMDGIETVTALREGGYQGQIIMLTISRRDEDLLGAIRAGANGYLLKDMDPADLQSAVYRVAAGDGVLAPDLTDRVFRAVSSPGEAHATDPLSPREQEVLILISQGYANAQIAADLSISVSTVKTHVRHILEKLDANNRSDAVRQAIQRGIIPSS